MTSKLKIVIWFLVVGSACFTLGLWIGTMFGGRPLRSLRAIYAAGWAGQMATLQYENAAYAEARQALLDYVNLLEKIIATQSEDSLPWAYHADMALALTRLSLLEETQGHSDDAKRFQQRAVEEARLGNLGKEPSLEKLRWLVKRLSGLKPQPAKSESSSGS